jgi:hypothetical protein
MDASGVEGAGLVAARLQGCVSVSRSLPFSWKKVHVDLMLDYSLTGVGKQGSGIRTGLGGFMFCGTWVVEI